MAAFLRLEHTAIARALRILRSDFLLDSRCWFAGGRIPDEVLIKSAKAYGTDVWRDAKWVVDHLDARPSELERAAHSLRMDVDLARQAIAAVRAEVVRAAGFCPLRELTGVSLTFEGGLLTSPSSIFE